jgi:hypothetical protein
MPLNAPADTKQGHCTLNFKPHFISIKETKEDFSLSLRKLLHSVHLSLHRQEYVKLEHMKKQKTCLSGKLHQDYLEPFTKYPLKKLLPKIQNIGNTISSNSTIGCTKAAETLSWDAVRK